MALLQSMLPWSCPFPIHPLSLLAHPPGPPHSLSSCFFLISAAPPPPPPFPFTTRQFSVPCLHQAGSKLKWTEISIGPVDRLKASTLPAPFLLLKPPPLPPPLFPPRPPRRDPPAQGGSESPAKCTGSGDLSLRTGVADDLS